MTADPWRAIEPTQWASVPVVQGRSATESDVKAGNAVFCVPIGEEYEPAAPHPLPLPSCPWLRGDAGSATPVIIVQAEVIDGKVALGYRPLAGGNGICLLSEVELLDEPDAAFLDGS